MGKPGPKFCLDNENKTKKKEKKNLRFWRGTEKNNIFQASRKAHVFPIFFSFLFSNVIQSTIHAQDYGVGEGGL